MTVEEFTAPPVEYLVFLETKTSAMRALMRGADNTSDEIEVPLDLIVTVTDDDAPGGSQDINFALPLTFTRPVSDDERNVSASLDYTQPLGRTSNIKFSTNALLVGNRAMRFTIGDGVATSFVLNHNLGSLSANFTANATTNVLTSAGHNLHNGDPVTVASTTTLPGGLSAGTTYYVISVTTDTFQLAATPGGSAIDLTTTGTGTHSFAVADGTTDAVFVEVWEKAGGQARISPEDYTVVRTSANAVTVSGFASTPTSNQYEVIIQTAGRPATYQAHTHTIAEVTGLQGTLDTIDARLDALEALAPSGVPFISNSTSYGVAIDRALLPVWSVLRARELPEVPSTLLGWAPYSLESPLRASRLLPAVHDAATETLPTTLPAPADAYKNRVFTTAADRTDFPGGLKNGDFAACDGREWYRVVRQGTTSTYHPAAFELELFRLAVNENQFTPRSVLEALFGFEVAYFPESRNPRDRRTASTWSLFVEIGEWTADSSPGTPGVNLDLFFTSAITVVNQRIHVTEQPEQHRFGVKVVRDGAGDLTVTPITYRKELATVSAPSSANFAIRARLARFDTEDTATDAKGLIAVRGLSVGLDGQEDETLGRLTIK
jgi:hypothetical protein